MLATILKSPQATQTTIAIIEAFAKLRELSRTIGEMSANPDQFKQKTLMGEGGAVVAVVCGVAVPCAVSVSERGWKVAGGNESFKSSRKTQH